MSKVELDFFVYSRNGCHLCEVMIEKLEDWNKQYNFNLNIVDIDKDEILQKKYAARVPVLVAGNVEICEYFLDENALSRLFQNPDKQ